MVALLYRLKIWSKPALMTAPTFRIMTTTMVPAMPGMVM